MAEYIEKEALIDAIYADGNLGAYMEYIINRVPAADVQEVRRGKWKRVVDFTGVEAFGYKETTIVGYGCNVCGYEVDVSEGDFNYCPNCGAKMDGEVEE